MTPIQKLRTAALLLLVATLAGCHESVSVIPAPEAAPITFRTPDNWGGTRLGDDGQFAAGDRIGVFAYYYNAAANATSEFMQDQMVKHDGTAWTYSPVKYWPTMAGDHLDFYAYYPYEAETRGRRSESGDFTLKFWMPATADQDLMVADAPGAKQAAGAVSLSFKHILSKLTFTIQSTGTTHQGKKLTGIVFNAPKYGEFDYDYATKKWSHASSASETQTVTLSFPAVEVTGTAADVGVTAYVIPCTIRSLTLQFHDQTNLVLDLSTDNEVTLTAGTPTVLEINIAQ